MRKVLILMIMLFCFLLGCNEQKYKLEDNMEFVQLDNLDKIDTKGWNLKFSQLMTPRRDVHPYHFLIDTLYESDDSKYACLFYTIFEASMNSYLGLVAVFKDKENPSLVVNPFNQWFYYNESYPLVFYKNFLVLRKVVHNENDSLSGLPFLILNLEKEVFGFIDFDYSSIHYQINFLDEKDCIIKLNDHGIEEIKNFKNRNNEIINLNSIKYYDFKKAQDIVNYYWAEKNRLK